MKYPKSVNIKAFYRYLLYFGLLLGLITVIAILLYGTKLQSTVKRQSEELGILAVKSLYDFGTSEQLDAQMDVLKTITTEPVFNQLSIDNEGRTLNTYLKFKNKPVTVEILDSSSDYVLYSLQTDSISSSRKFLFIFSVDDNGLISSVREMEAIDFVDSY